MKEEDRLGSRDVNLCAILSASASVLCNESSHHWLNCRRGRLRNLYLEGRAEATLSVGFRARGNGTHSPRPLSFLVFDICHTGHPSPNILHAASLADGLDGLVDRLNLVARHAVPKGAAVATKRALDCENCGQYTGWVSGREKGLPEVPKNLARRALRDQARERDDGEKGGVVGEGVARLRRVVEDRMGC